MWYRRTIEEMPAWEKDIEEAIEEGVTIHPMWTPKQIMHKDGKITGIEFVRSKTVSNDDGSSRLSVDEKSTQLVEAGTIIISIGQAPDISFLSEDSQLERALWGSLAVDDNSLVTNIPGVFAGGGPSTVIKAIASGRRAALALDRHLRGEKGRIEIVDEKSLWHEDIGLALDQEDEIGEKPRANIEVENAKERVRDFREVEKGFNEDQAQYEAMRCLRCDLERDRR
jgi:NADH-quinone oxidoreductase subunit F